MIHRLKSLNVLLELEGGEQRMVHAYADPFDPETQRAVDVYEPSGYMGPHSSITSRSTFDANGHPSFPESLPQVWGSVTHRRHECPLPVGPDRFAFYEAKRAEDTAEAVRLVRVAFPDSEVSVSGGWVYMTGPA